MSARSTPRPSINLMPVLRNLRDTDHQGPMLLHVVPKGKGYPPAERSADKYHGVVKFNVVTGEHPRAGRAAVLHQGLRRGVAAEAAADPGSLPYGGRCPPAPASIFSPSVFPDRTFDCRHREQHAVTFAAGMRPRA